MWIPYPGRLQRLGLRLRLQTGRQAWRLRGARRRLIFDVKSAAFNILLRWLRLGCAGPGPRLNFSSPPESPTDGLSTCRLTYVPAYLRSGLPTFRLTYSLQLLPTWLLSSSISSSSGTSIFLFYVIGFFFVYKIIFLFLSSKYAVEACDSNIADIVHFSNHVQASHVMHLFLCCWLSPIFLPCVFYLFLTWCHISFPRALYLQPAKYPQLGSRVGGGVFFSLPEG
jgi:hypothetical protein